MSCEDLNNNLLRGIACAGFLGPWRLVLGPCISLTWHTPKWLTGRRILKNRGNPKVGCLTLNSRPLYWGKMCWGGMGFEGLGDVSDAEMAQRWCEIWDGLAWELYSPPLCFLLSFVPEGTPAAVLMDLEEELWFIDYVLGLKHDGIVRDRSFETY